MKKVAFLPSLFCFSKLNSIYLAFPAIINRSGDAFVLQYNILFKRRVALYINFWLLCLEIIPSEETVADAMTYYVQAYATVCVVRCVRTHFTNRGMCQKVDNAVVSLVGARFARPKTVYFVPSDRQTLPLQPTMG